MHGSRPVVLLTGFGPFPGMPANATSVLVPPLAQAAQRAFPGVRVVAEIVPTEWSAGLDRMRALYDELTPAAAVHFGVSSRARGFEVEARGRNVASPLPDAAGCFPPDDCIATNGPAWLGSNLPVQHIVMRLRQRGLPAYVSRDAGGYLCNALFYSAPDLVRSERRGVRNGFVHLPSALVDERDPPRGPLAVSPLDWRGVMEGGIEILAATLGARPVTMPHAPAAIRPRRGP